MHIRCWRNYKEYFLIAVLAFIMAGAAIYGKKNYFVDEIYSYGLANSENESISLPITDGVTYYHNDPYTEYMNSSDSFPWSFRYVWANQIQDVHPPLYYAVVHVVCSLMPGTFSIWYTGVINIVFFILTMALLGRMIERKVNNRKYAAIAMIAFVTCAGILQACTLLRMYIMAMFILTALSYWHLFNYDLNHFKTGQFYGLILLIFVGGLTHYYIIIFMVFEALFFSIHLFLLKQYRYLKYYWISLVTGASLAWLAFPDMFNHIFNGGRGKQAFENFQSTGGYSERLLSFIGFWNNDFSGGILFWGLLIVMIAWLILRVAGKKAYPIDRENICCIVLPCIGYFLLVSKTAAFVADRYLYPVYAILFYLIYLLLVRSASFFLAGDERKSLVALILVAVCFNLWAWKNCNWEYSYLNDQAVSSAEKYGDKDCIYVYDQKWKANPSFEELGKYRSVTFYSEEDISSDVVQQMAEAKGYVLYIAVEDSDMEKKILQQTLKQSGKNAHCVQISEFGYATSYYIE